MDAKLKERLHLRGELIWSYEIGTGCRIREPCVRLCNQWKRCPLPHLLDQGKNLIRPQGAVYSDCVRTKTLKSHSHAGDRCSGKRPSVLLEAHCDPDGECGVLFCCKKCGSCLLEVCECLKDNQICSGILAGHHHFLEDVISLIKGEGPKRREKLTDRTYIQSNFCVEGLCGCSFGNLDICFYDIRGVVACSLQFSSVGTKGVGVEDAAS